MGGDDPAICEKGGSGLLFPLFGDSEQEWPRALRITLYLLGLAWCFMGVAIIADVFMSAIEKVTSKKIRRWNKTKGRFYTFEVWNGTVANLTLMALGSSAPEILLNVIDIFSKEFYLEGLGPGTIVGSASFNLLMIIAVCIMAIPDGEVRIIQDFPVYVCTASWSVFAYLWLIIILVLVSPNVVEVWEGVLTFIFFPALVFMAFAFDKGWIVAKPDGESDQFKVHEGMSPEELAEVEAQVRAIHGQDLTTEQVFRILSVTKPQSRAVHRIHATRQMFGGRRLKSATTKIMRSMTTRFFSRKKVVPLTPTEEETHDCVIGFDIVKYAVLEHAGLVSVKIARKGSLEQQARVHYKTEDGSAKAPGDYEAVEGWAEFAPGETEAQVKIAIVDDIAYEEDEDFFLQLSSPQLYTKDGELDDLKSVVLGEKSKAQIIIIDDDDPGMVTFEEESLTLHQGASDYEAKIKVIRRNGSCGDIAVKYEVEGATAILGRDFEATGGVLFFSNEQIEAYIPVTIKSVPRYDLKDVFRIILSDPQNGACLDPNRDGGEKRNIATIAIAANVEGRERVDKVMKMLQAKWGKSQIGHANWATQFKEALYVNGGCDDDEEQGNPPSTADYVMHIMTVPWKVLFALVPPVDYCGGWACFWCALLMIGIVTAVISDVASLLGCVLCIPDEVTAISFVALGTSLPDTFASRTAALQDATADASVGNVTGSNSVNVFLGLGLPWAIASIYWAAVGESADWHRRYDGLADLDFLGAQFTKRTQGFVVEAKSLSFNVVVFTCCAVICLVLLFVRRTIFGGELGGPEGPKRGSAACLVLLWLLYIALSSWKSIDESGGLQCL